LKYSFIPLLLSHCLLFTETRFPEWHENLPLILNQQTREEKFPLFQGYHKEKEMLLFL
jgi:hypothetical protein